MTTGSEQLNNNPITGINIIYHTIKPSGGTGRDHTLLMKFEQPDRL